jgi:hypothetical protein
MRLVRARKRHGGRAARSAGVPARSPVGRDHTALLARCARGRPTRGGPVDGLARAGSTDGHERSAACARDRAAVRRRDVGLTSTETRHDCAAAELRSVEPGPLVRGDADRLRITATNNVRADDAVRVRAAVPIERRQIVRRTPRRSVAKKVGTRRTVHDVAIAVRALEVCVAIRRRRAVRQQGTGFTSHRQVVVTVGGGVAAHLRRTNVGLSRARTVLVGAHHATRFWRQGDSARRDVRRVVTRPACPTVRDGVGRHRRAKHAVRRHHRARVRG